MSTTPLADATHLFEDLDPVELRRSRDLVKLARVVAYMLDHLRDCERQRAEQGRAKVEP